MDWSSFIELVGLAGNLIQSPRVIPQKSLVGSLSSIEFMKPVGNNLPVPFMNNFRVMLYALSLQWITETPKEKEGYRDLGYKAGREVLDGLDWVFLNKGELVGQRIPSIFLVLVATLLAVIYSQPTNLGLRSAKQSQQSLKLFDSQFE